MGDERFAVRVTVPVAVPNAIPEEFSHLIGLNRTFGVLICIPCKHAVEPRALVRHLKRMHLKREDEVSKVIWRKAAEYIESFPCNYTHSTMELPEDGSEAQEILAVRRVWECTECGPRPFRSISEKGLRAHRARAHAEVKGKRVKDTAREVDIQSWYLDNRARYWRINKVAKAGNVDAEPEQVPYRRVAEAKGCGERAAVEGWEASIVVGGRQRREGRAGRRRRRVTEVGVQAADEVAGQEVERDRRKPIDDIKGGAVVTVKGAKRRVSTSAEADEGGQQKRVRFVEHVEIGGLAGLKQQLDRWSKECVVCYFVAEDKGLSGSKHTVWECQQEVAEEIRAHSRHMDRRIEKEQGVAERGCCRMCWVPRAVCERWDWDRQQRRWAESGGQCQYDRVLIPAMMAMMKLGATEVVTRLAWQLQGDRVDAENRAEVYRWYSKRIWWEGVEAEQVVVALMILAQGNGVLGVSKWDNIQGAFRG